MGHDVTLYLFIYLSIYLYIYYYYYYLVPFHTVSAFSFFFLSFFLLLRLLLLLCRLWKLMGNSFVSFFLLLFMLFHHPCRSFQHSYPQPQSRPILHRGPAARSSQQEAYASSFCYLDSWASCRMEFGQDHRFL